MSECVYNTPNHSSKALYIVNHFDLMTTTDGYFCYLHFKERGETQETNFFQGLPEILQRQDQISENLTSELHTNPTFLSPVYVIKQKTTFPLFFVHYTGSIRHISLPTGC